MRESKDANIDDYCDNRDALRNLEVITLMPLLIIVETLPYLVNISGDLDFSFLLPLSNAFISSRLSLG